MRNGPETGCGAGSGKGNVGRGIGAWGATLARHQRDGVMRRGAACAAIVLCASVLGCNGDSRVKEFRERATPGIQAGVEQLIGGILDGLFAVSDPDSTSGG